MKKGKQIGLLLCLAWLSLLLTGCLPEQEERPLFEEIAPDSPNYSQIVNNMLWACPDCGHVNHANVKRCVICGAEKPAS